MAEKKFYDETIFPIAELIKKESHLDWDDSDDLAYKIYEKFIK